ncbi:hypothetical protein BRD13_07135 [Halobacteriales archaeon SW_5_70_135]|nr:MAG: hypothetical protein BRD13_07135 [Halobacteriales archaeon SW_5_70_135]
MGREMTDFIRAYARAEDLNERYTLLREEMAVLRDSADDDERYDPDAVRETVRDLAASHGGRLVVFVADDFGLPVNFRPEGLEPEKLDGVRRAILEEKYDHHQSDLDAVRRDLLDEHPRIHKAIVADVGGDDVRYHLPEGSNEKTNFLTVRETVGLVDYTTNSAQAGSQSRTYRT